MAFQNRTYRAATMNRREFAFNASVHISGNATVGKLFVAGDLTVDGKLDAVELYCLGKVTVVGAFTARRALLGACIEVGGAVHVEDMAVGIDAGVIARCLLGVQALDQARTALFKTLHPAVVSNHAQLKELFSDGVLPALRAKSLTGGTMYARGSACIEGAIQAESVETTADLTAGTITVSAEVVAAGTLTCQASITAGGYCGASELVCRGDVRAKQLHYGQLRVGGTVTADQMKQADGGTLPAPRYKIRI